MGYYKEKNVVADVRYSMIPNQIVPMWGLTIDEQRGINDHATWWTSRNLDKSQRDLFINMLKGLQQLLLKNKTKHLLKFLF